MTTANAQLTEIRQYIEDLEVGLTERLDALAARLAAIEKKLARLDARLPKGAPPPAALSRPDQEESPKRSRRISGV